MTILSQSVGIYVDFNMRKLYLSYCEANGREDTLIVNSKSYDVDTIDDLPDDLHPKNMCEKSNAQCLVFGGMYSEYSKHSNWSHSSNSLLRKNMFVLGTRLHVP